MQWGHEGSLRVHLESVCAGDHLLLPPAVGQRRAPGQDAETLVADSRATLVQTWSQEGRLNIWPIVTDNTVEGRRYSWPALVRYDSVRQYLPLLFVASRWNKNAWPGLPGYGRLVWRYPPRSQTSQLFRGQIRPSLGFLKVKFFHQKLFL